MLKSEVITKPLATLEERARRIAGLIDHHKGEQVTIMDLRGLTDFADAFVVATARSRTHLHAIISHIADDLRKEDMRPLATPDRASERWEIIDYGDIIVHVFDAATRVYYDLEDLWGDAEILDWEPLPAEQRGE